MYFSAYYIFIYNADRFCDNPNEKDPKSRFSKMLKETNGPKIQIW